MTTPDPPEPAPPYQYVPSEKHSSLAPPPPPKLAVPPVPPAPQKYPELSVLVAPLPAFVPPVLVEPPPLAPYVCETPENVDTVPVPEPESL